MFGQEMKQSGHSRAIGALLLALNSPDVGAVESDHGDLLYRRNNRLGELSFEVGKVTVISHFEPARRPDHG